METTGFPVQTVTRAPESITETLAFIGLGSQWTRGALVATVATATAYAMKWPKQAFTADGKMKQFSPTVEDSEYGEALTTPIHFGVVPVAAFVLAYYLL
jgi:hypothetical protein